MRTWLKYWILKAFIMEQPPKGGKPSTLWAEELSGNAKYIRWNAKFKSRKKCSRYLILQTWETSFPPCVRVNQNSSFLSMHNYQCKCAFILEIYKSLKGTFIFKDIIHIPLIKIFYGRKKIERCLKNGFILLRILIWVFLLSTCIHGKNITYFNR